jgi:hypothetical protein
MSKTDDMLIHYLLELDVRQQPSEFYGVSMKLDQITKHTQMVCVDRDCSRFKDVDQLKPGDVVYMEDELGELEPIRVT